MWLSKKKKYVGGDKRTYDTILYAKGMMGPADGYGHSLKLRKKILKAGKSWITINK